MTPQEKFICVIANDTLKKADAVIILEGDGLARIEAGAKLFREGWAPCVVISGGINNPPHSIPAKEMRPVLIEAGVSSEAILLEEKSTNTWEQGVEIMKLVQEKKWKSIILVASHYHQYRSYLTFLKAMQVAGITINIMCSPVRNLPWFGGDGEPRRFDLLTGEFERISKYTLQGHMASFEDALVYQEWKEGRV